MISLGSQAQLGIGISVSLYNNFSSTANKINTDLLAMKKNASSAALSAIRDYRNQAGAVALGATAASAGMYQMAKDGAQLQHRINQIAVLGGSALGMTRKQIAEMDDELAIKFARRPAEMAEAVLENVRAGIKTNMKMITDYQTAAASITGEQLGGEDGVAKKLIGVMNAMGMTEKEFPRIANAMAQGANLSMASIASIGESMEYAAFTAKQFGVPLEETIALVTKLSQASIEGSSAGTALNNMFMQLGASLGKFRTKKQEQSWHILGIDPDKMKALMDSGKIFQVVAAIDKASAALSPSDKISVLKNLVNLRGTRAVLGAFGNPNQPNSSLTNLLNGIKGGVGTDVAQRQAAAATNDLASDMIRLQASWDSFKRSFSEAAAPVLRTFLDTLSRVTRFIGPLLDTGVGKFLVGMVAVAAPLVAILAGFRVAALSATLALNQLAVFGKVGGFRGLMQAGWGAAGMTGLFGTGLQALRQNVASGRWQVKAGQTFNYGGKVYGPGKFVPNAAMAGTGLGMGIGNTIASSGWLGGSGLGSKIAGFAGKAAPMLGKIVGTGLKMLPVVGTVLMIGSLVADIFGFLKSSKEKEPPPPPNMKEFYLQQLRNNAFGTPVSPTDFNKDDTNKKSQLQQNINIYIDGQKAAERRVTQGWQDVNNDYMMNFIQ